VTKGALFLTESVAARSHARDARAGRTSSPPGLARRLLRCGYFVDSALPGPLGVVV